MRGSCARPEVTGWRQALGSWAFGDNASRWFGYPVGRGKPLDQVQLTVDEFHLIAGVTPSQALLYYDAVRRTMGGQQETDRFARLHLVPGMSHCGGGPTPNTSDLLVQVVRWVEDGQAPESILVTDRNPATQGMRQRPVFRHPLVARYVGPDPAQDPSGPDKLDNFVAAAPAKRHDSIDWVGDFLLAPPRATAVRRRDGTTARPRLDLRWRLGEREAGRSNSGRPGGHPECPRQARVVACAAD